MFKASASVLALLLCFSLSSPLMAQTTATQDIIQSERPVPPTNNSITGFAVDFLNDQKAIWTSPFHMTAGDATFLAPAAVGVGKPLVVFGSYGFATAVSLARVGGLNHFPSDVVAGAVIGELIGRYVVHHHAVLAEQ